MIQIGGGAGGAATPAGSDTQVQFNDGGAFGGDSGLVFNKTTDTLTVGKQLVISSGSLTASTPVLDLAQTWNNAAVTFTAAKINVTDTASAATSKLLDVQLGGTSQFEVRKDGTAIVGNASGGGGLRITTSGSFQPVLSRNSDGGLILGSNTGTQPVYIGTNDVSIIRDAADILAQRRSTTAQTFRIYNTFTDASNYERGKIAWVTNVLQIGTEKAGTGTARALALQTDGTTRLTVEAAGSLTVADANNIVVGTTTGTKIGTATTQKLGFYNAAPVVQPAAVADATGAGDVVAQLNALLSRMRNLGLIAP